jgi:hypothetical protein
MVIILNCCQTYKSNYSVNTIEIQIIKGDFEIILESKIEDKNEYNDPNALGLIIGVLGHQSPRKEVIRLNAGDGYSYTLIKNEVLSIKYKPIIIDSNGEKPELIIIYRGKETKYNLKTKIGFTKTYKYI